MLREALRAQGVEDVSEEVLSKIAAKAQEQALTIARAKAKEEDSARDTLTNFLAGGEIKPEDVPLALKALYGRGDIRLVHGSDGPVVYSGAAKARSDGAGGRRIGGQSGVVYVRDAKGNIPLGKDGKHYPGPVYAREAIEALTGQTNIPQGFNSKRGLKAKGFRVLLHNPVESKSMRVPANAKGWWEFVGGAQGSIPMTAKALATIVGLPEAKDTFGEGEGQRLKEARGQA